VESLNFNCWKISINRISSGFMHMNHEFMRELVLFGPVWLPKLKKRDTCIHYN
jgi:hypothetical protein